jgi:hypothetical protein
MTQVMMKVGYVLVVLTAAFIFLSSPVLAQSSDVELETSIRAALQADPRSSTLTQQEFDALVAALTTQAKIEGVTSADFAPTTLSDESAQPLEQVMKEPFLNSDLALILFILFTLGVSWLLLKKLYPVTTTPSVQAPAQTTQSDLHIG